MTSITLYGVAVSAFVAKVRIVLDMKGLIYTELAPPDGYGSSSYRAIVPAGSVPGLVVDGQSIHDSNAIIEWLEETVPTPALLPMDPIARARTRALLGFHDTRLEAATRRLFPLVKRDWRGEPDAVAAGADDINAALVRLGDMVSPSPFMNGNAPSLADICFPVTVQMAQMLLDEMQTNLIVPPKIADWVVEVSKIEAVSRSIVIAHQAMEDWLLSFR